MEGVHRTIRDGLFKYFSYKNSYRFIVVLPKFVKAYNDKVHWTTGIATSPVTESDVLAKWIRMKTRTKGRVRVAKAATFRVGLYVRINKEKIHFANAAERNLSPRYSGHEINREAAVSRLRARGFKRHAYRRPVLPHGIDPRTNN